jgi:hypothetical protein
MPDENKKQQPRDDDEASNAVEDVIEFFEAEGEADSPTSDSGTQPPG